MQTKTAILGMIVALGAACGSTPTPPPQHAPEPLDDAYRPGWTAAISLHLDDIRLCLEGREPPTAVVHVQALASGATGITDVDGFGQVENCAVDRGHVVIREPTLLEPADLDGLPLFSLGPSQPVVGFGVLLEQVTEKETLLGWLYWPRGDGKETTTAEAPLE